MLRPPLANIAMALPVAACWIAGYHLVAALVDPAATRELRTPVDDAIPFLPASVFLYSWAYTSTLYPLFTVRHPSLFRRVALAYLAVTAVSMAAFALVPVTAVHLRADLAALDRTRFTDWGVWATYTLDPPLNLFPSLHVAFTTLAALSAWRARRLFGLLAMPMVAAVALSTMTMKQHFAADVVAGLALGWAAWRAFLRPFEPPAGVHETDLSWSWHGPLAYALFHLGVYFGFYVLFRTGALAG